MREIYRKDEIIKMCHNKTVLHLGFIQHSHLYKELIQSGEWLHDKIYKVSRKLVGFDYLKEDVEIIKKEYDYECYYADVTKLEDVDYNEKFDIIVCGELIEHLDNPGLMLNGIKKFMHQDTLLIITTPNPWSKKRLSLIKKGKYESEWLNKEHTCWFSYQTLKQLLERYNYVEVKYEYYHYETINDTKLFKINFLNKLKKAKDLMLLKDINKNGLFFIAKLNNAKK